mmetsp:Transcript_59642/g.146224  ORF Transcript_59642/g.146224 Transcript_59642/m.146224 type:complete len:444 (-) Transcript_59642:3450-4781(-)|eukprot:CAMPEP_0113441692 /NCGR_PEP_ID=MMETSP0014_2-20120614/1215_1 /TAXON_ID=2857 /ORGANISM="Nitzschia sp." /LENGTH=443 /DNA_ID=CAMNT_0000332547 /DNA_START=155 /DNA_END=1486 /DNA_ORIENTATION=- /assembly_acc=CAM_ASM_000159
MPSSLTKRVLTFAMNLGQNDGEGGGQDSSGATSTNNGIIPTLWHHFNEIFIRHDPEEWAVVRQRLTEEIIDPFDLTFLIVLSSLSFLLTTSTPTRQNDGNNNSSSAASTTEVPLSYFDLIIINVSQLARLSLVMYVIDSIVVTLETLSDVFDPNDIIDNENNDNENYEEGSATSSWSSGLAKILYISWAAQRLSVFKRYGLNKIFSKAEDDETGRVTAIDRLMDGSIIACTFFITLDVLNVDLGMSGVTSVFAFSSAGTLVVGLASQNLATMFVNGLLLTTSDRILEGDYIEFKDTCGKITKIGWFQTTLRHYDEKIEVIPNSELGMQRVTNLSRVKRCRVKQALRFHYDSVDKLDVVLPEIIEEIKRSCPEVISDGTAPLRAVWTDFKEDHISINVEARFNLPPMGNLYHNNRQECLKAIYRACRKHGVEFVVGLYPNGINK